MIVTLKKKKQSKNRTKETTTKPSSHKLLKHFF